MTLFEAERKDPALAIAALPKILKVMDLYEEALNLITRIDYINDYDADGIFVRVRYPNDCAAEALKRAKEIAGE